MVDLHLYPIDAPASQYMPPRLAEVAERAHDAYDAFNDHVSAHRDVLASDWLKRAQKRDDEAMMAGEAPATSYVEQARVERAAALKKALDLKREAETAAADLEDCLRAQAADCLPLVDADLADAEAEYLEAEAALARARRRYEAVVGEKIRLAHVLDGGTYGRGRASYRADTGSAQRDVNKAAAILEQLPDGPIAPEERAFRSVRLRSGRILRDMDAAHARKFVEEGRGEYVD